MSNQSVLFFIVLGFCMVLSFLFSGMESGVFALNRLRVRQLMRGGDVRALVLHRYLENSENFLWTIFVGNTLVNFTCFTLLALSLHGWLKQWPALELCSFVISIFLFFILCELLPKTLFRLFPNRLCLLLAKPFRVIHAILRPPVALASWFSRKLLPWTGGKVFTGRLSGGRDELRFVMQESSQSLSLDEKNMINRVLDLQNVTVAQITVSLANTITVETGTTMKEVLRISREKNLTRFPVVKKVSGRDQIIGIVSLKKLLYRDDLDLARPAGDFVNPALFLQEDLRLEEALRRLQRSGRRLAVVLSREQREIGIVSLQDILKTIFGEVSL
ncbi:MAG: CNNM domain-containing protein [Verrucomicrobiota bacterium]